MMERKVINASMHHKYCKLFGRGDDEDVETKAP